MSVKKSIGRITAYAAAVEGGYTGTYEKFCRDQAKFAENAQQVAADAAEVAENLRESKQVLEDVKKESAGLVGLSAAVEEHTTRLDSAEERITALEGRTITAPYYVDASVAYVKDVPKNALPFAEINKIGGSTRTCTNLIPFPYTGGGAGYDSEINGMKINTLNDGGIAFSGTPTGYVGFVVYNGAVLSKGEQVISLQGTFSGIYAVLYLYDSNKSEIAQFSLSSTNNSVKLNMGSYPSAASMNLTIARAAAGTSVGGTVYPMLNSGDTALPYEPYFDGLRSAAVTAVESVGVNLYSFGDKAIDGFQRFYFDKALPAGTYTVSALVSSTDTDDTRTSLVFMGENEALAYAHIKRDVYNRATITTTREATSIRLLSSTSVAKSEGDSSIWKNVMICKGEASLPYEPYRSDTLPIPAAVQALSGYGQGNPDKPSEYNAIVWGNNGKVSYSHKGDITDGAWIPLATAENIDISDLFTDDNYIPVEPGGTVTMENEHGYDVPSEITFARLMWQ